MASSRRPQSTLWRGCEECDIQTGVWLCTGCNEYFCDDHWRIRRAHRDNQLGPGGIPHEKVERRIAEQVKTCLAEPSSDSDQDLQHLADIDTTWFGLDRDAGGDPILAEYRRYAAIMMEHAQDVEHTRYPALVSFIGQTGSGKSSLIRLLIDPKRHDVPGSATATAAPVVGRSNCEVPTSADVHLYADPKSYTAHRPVLYADCEGFDGGERDPIASLAVVSDVNHLAENMANKLRLKHAPTSGSSKTFTMLARGTKRALKWAKRDSPDYEETSKRGYAVQQMYPRILYAFSDVIVFVLTNPRTLEDVIERLLNWAHSNYTRSTNLPSKPHAIIALNRSDHSTADYLWDPVNATASLLKSTNAQINKNSTFRRYVAMWKSANVHIRDVSDLIKCYYSTVKVVRLPDGSRLQRMDDQRKALYRVIRDCCEDTMEVKMERRMLPDVDEFGLYLSLAFDHFSESLDVPFDYVEASLKHRPPPVTLTDNMQDFIVMIAEQMHRLDVTRLFQLLTPFVASCLMLDSSRKQRIGQAGDWFDHVHSKRSPQKHDGKKSGKQQQTSGNSYRDICRSVMQWYDDFYVPCEGTCSTVMKRRVPCQQVRKYHGAMHRARTTIRATDWEGEFRSSFNRNRFAWESRVLQYMRDLENRHQWYDPENPRLARAKAHRNSLLELYGRIKIRHFFSNSICLCCLANPPEHELRCGHVICTECAMDFGRVDLRTQIVVDKCPLHDKSLGSYEPRQTIFLEPPFTGLRVLVLDGGGIRGIVEIGVMQAIEQRLGLPLQSFFDLVVGTSTGGVIALAFGDQMYSLKKCDRLFTELSQLAFKLRKGQGLKFYKTLQVVVKKSKYESKPLVKALMDTFSSNTTLFGGRTSQLRLKVAVTATSSSGSQAYVMSNYNTWNARNTNDGRKDVTVSYTRYRPFNPDDEIKVWESARCTSAAPGYFKPFTSNHFPELMDGGILHNNPVEIALEEARRLAETSQQMRDPDIVLSLGTCLQNETPNSHQGVYVSSMSSSRQNTSWIRNLFTIIGYQVKLNLDTEKRWKSVRGQNHDLQGRMHRVNPDLGEAPPAMDEVAQLEPLRRKVHDWLRQRATRTQIAEIACVLVASTFYFERSGNAAYGAALSIELPGYIKCRLSHDSEAVKGLGRFLSAANNRVYFDIHNLPSDRAQQRYEVPVEMMEEAGVWDDVLVSVKVPGEDAKTTITIDMPGICTNGRQYPISGFPRTFMRADFEGKQI